jgi:hypothetical protein
MRSRSLHWTVLTALPLALAAAACGAEKIDDKGAIDDSAPPADPTADGKSDEASQVVAVQIESAHPYANNTDRTYAVDLGVLPSCAIDARLHFSAIRTEESYDFVTVEPGDGETQSFDGHQDDTWTDFFKVAGGVQVRLEADYSITDHGFVIDGIEWDGQPAECGIAHFTPCAAGTVDTAPRPGVCECPIQPVCVPLADVVVRHGLARAFNRTAKVIDGTVATTERPSPSDGTQETEVGTVDGARVKALVERAAATGVLHQAGYDRPIDSAGFREELTFTAGEYQVSFVATQGTHDPEVASFIAEFEALFACNGDGGLTCGGGFECGDDGVCNEVATCVCPALYQPVCGVDGRTYSNGCAAGCAEMPVAHSGECGQPGDMCGGFGGFGCTDENRCRYDVSTFDAPHPDASGTCVARTYCDAPADCNGLAHPAVPGSWACETNACGWRAGLAWKPVTNGRFETAHPYANSTSAWKQVYLPAEAQALRLVVNGSFRLEANYDFLDVWTWQGGAWVRTKRFTGTTAPSGTEEFAGRYFYLHFVSDSSITDSGFAVDAQWR